MGYVGYLVGGVAWPRAAYRFGFGPAAPPILQGVFAAAGELAAERPDHGDLVALGLIADQASTAAADPAPAAIERLMDRAHAAGIAGVAASFRRMVTIGGGELRFGDLSGARKYKPGSVHFNAARDADRRAFNRNFGAALMTEQTARQALRQANAAVETDRGSYAPMDFGCGLTVGDITSSNEGAGAWAFATPFVAPLVAGRRVLDLGSHNGTLPLMMLRAGAREVVAIEFTPAVADFARLSAKILSWRDVRPYRIDVVTGDIRLFLTQDLGPFDVVTAFCSLYYLPEEDMARIVAKAAAMGATLILQANDAIDNLPAKTLDLHRLMRDNGYPEIEIHTPAGFAHPLLVGSPQISRRTRRGDVALR
jgi:2-polyprenyl-3-methyl-5-hydroxy-6-metoxy-1,4-benzoquinol methylase